MHFRSISDLNADVLANLHRLPRDIDIVVGVPRSGLLAAALISLAFNLPLADVEGFAQGRVLASGRTKRHTALDTGFEGFRHALLVDDSIQSGTSMAAARAAVSKARPDLKITTLAVYGVHGFNMGADLVFARVSEPRIFQWNVMHHGILSAACLDIDGVLCIDPLPRENDDGRAYMRFLTDAAPLHRPTRRIHALVTSRLEKYRSQTEAWLEARGVEYDHLFMLDLPDAASRRAANAHAAFKASVYAQSPATKLFIESERNQAIEIAARSKKPVLWLPGAEMMYHDGAPPKNPRAALETANRAAFRARQAVRAALGERAYALLRDTVKPILAPHR